MNVQLGDLDAAERAWADAARLAREAVVPRLANEVLRLEAVLLAARGRHDAALARLDVARDTATARGDQRLLFSVAEARAASLRALGRGEEAIAAIHAALDAARRARSPGFEGEALLALAAATGAETDWRAAWTHAAKLGLPRMRVRAALGLGGLLRAAHPDEARALAAEVAPLAASLGDPALAAGLAALLAPG